MDIPEACTQPIAIANRNRRVENAYLRPLHRFEGSRYAPGANKYVILVPAPVSPRCGAGGFAPRWGRGPNTLRPGWVQGAAHCAPVGGGGHFFDPQWGQLPKLLPQLLPGSPGTRGPRIPGCGPCRATYCTDRRVGPISEIGARRLGRPLPLRAMMSGRQGLSWVQGVS